MWYLGFDIGGTKCAVSLGESSDGQARIIERREFPTPPDWQSALETMFQMGEAIIAERGIAPAAAGFSCGGPLNAEAGLVQAPPHLPAWVDVPVVQLARERLRIPAFLENDANACALAEWRWGAGQGADNVIFMTFGTGLGAGMILNGRLYRGANGNAGELGHMRLAAFGPTGYGKPGSFEGFCSGAGIAQLAATMGLSAVQRGETPSFWKNGAIVSAREVAEAARAGDQTALDIFSFCGEMLGQGLAVLVDIINPDRIIIGSIYTRCEDLLAPAVQRALKRESLPFSLNVARVLPARLGDQIGDYAALCVAEYGLSGEQ